MDAKIIVKYNCEVPYRPLSCFQIPPLNIRKQSTRDITDGLIIKPSMAELGGSAVESLDRFFCKNVGQRMLIQ